MSDLLPCPFCGSEAAIGGAPGAMFVNCVDCHASTNILVPEVGPETPEEAIAAWNTRTVQAQIDAAVLAERERCAKVANAHLVSSSFGSDHPVRVVYSEFIAAAIRKGDQP